MKGELHPNQEPPEKRRAFLHVDDSFECIDLLPAVVVFRESDG